MQIREIKLKIRVIVEHNDDGYMAYCPEFPGLAVEALDFEELKRHMNDAIHGYLESLLKHGDPIPVGIMESEEEFTFFEFATRKIRARFNRSYPTQYIQEFSYSGSNNHACA